MSQIAALPASVESITPDWLSQVASTRFPGCDAEALAVVDAHSGTTGRARLRVRWRPGAAAPAALFAKLAPTDPIQRAMVVTTGMGRREARFYAELAREMSIRVPAPVWSGWGEGGEQYFMLMEDLVEAGCRFPASQDDDGVEHAPAMLRTLAELHAGFWQSPRFQRDLSWIEAPMRHEIGPQLVREAVRQFGGRMPSAFEELAELYIDHWQAVSDLVDSGPQTLVHGDSHLGNTFWDGDRVGLLDWACVARAPGMRDVSYYLCSSIPTDARRASEGRLIEGYLASLAAAGAAAPSFEDAFRQYRRCAICGWIAATVTAAAGSRMQPIAVGLRAMQRSTAAIIDLSTPALLREELGL